jgi:hypothetical protein
VPNAAKSNPFKMMLAFAGCGAMVSVGYMDVSAGAPPAARPAAALPAATAPPPLGDLP